MGNAPAVRYYDDVVPGHRALFEGLLTEVVWDERMRARKTASFGVPYNYSGIECPPTAWPTILDETRDAVEAVTGWRANNCLLNLYRDGADSMGMHADMVEGLEEGTAVAVVSLGATRTLVFEDIGGENRCCYSLESGSLLVMPLSVQSTWKHGVPRTDCRDPRISVTLRRIRT